MSTSQVTNEEFSAEHIPQSNWFKFEKVGDSIKGTLRSHTVKPGNAGFGDQHVYELSRVEINGVADEDTEAVYNIGIKKTPSDFVANKLKKAQIGQRIGMVFEKEIPPSQKGYKAAKSITPYIWGMDPEFESFGAKQSDSPAISGEIDVNDIPF